jgi:hypothetical protein
LSQRPEGVWRRPAQWDFVTGTNAQRSVAHFAALVGAGLDLARCIVAPSPHSARHWPGWRAAMRRFWLALGAFLLAFVLTWAAAIGYYVLGTSLGWFFDRDGGVAMGTIFIGGPSLGLLAGLACAVIVAWRTRATGGR